MPELQEHGYPDWQRLSQQQGERLYASNSVSVKKGSPVILGPFYVGLTPALTLYAIGRFGSALTRVNIIWGATEALAAPRITEEFILAEEESLLYQQLTCQGQWVAIEFNAITVTEEPTYEVILQPNALVYSEPRLGNGLLLHQTFAVAAGKETTIKVTRVGPGPATIRFVVAEAEVNTWLTVEYFFNGVWSVLWVFFLGAVSAERKTGGVLAENFTLPRSPVRFKVNNFGAKDQTGRILVTIP